MRTGLVVNNESHLLVQESLEYILRIKNFGRKEIAIWIIKIDIKNK